MTEVCRWQRAHSKLCFLVFSCHPRLWPQAGHRKPFGHRTATSRRAPASGNRRWKAMRLAGLSVMGRFHVKNVMRTFHHPTSRTQCLVSQEPCAISSSFELVAEFRLLEAV